MTDEARQSAIEAANKERSAILADLHARGVNIAPFGPTTGEFSVRESTVAIISLHGLRTIRDLTAMIPDEKIEEYLKAQQ